jgi:hypothetical protein
MGGMEFFFISCRIYLLSWYKKRNNLSMMTTQATYAGLWRSTNGAFSPAFGASSFAYFSFGYYFR